MKYLVVANWKMNPASAREALRLFEAAARIAAAYRRKMELVVCPPFIYLPYARQKQIREQIPLSRHSDISRYRPIDLSTYRLGAQDCFWENPRDDGPARPRHAGGAYTGEISADMLAKSGARFVICGHSERREYFGETNAVIAKKVAVALSAGLAPILCVGERERNEMSSYLSFIKQEIKEGLSLVKKTRFHRVIIAYEPIWAIGTDAHPIATKDVLEMNLYIKKILHGIWGTYAAAIRVIYGGSVAPGYAAQFLTEGGMSGLLIGHQSLKSKALEKIVNEVARSK